MSIELGGKNGLISSYVIGKEDFIKYKELYGSSTSDGEYREKVRYTLPKIVKIMEVQKLRENLSQLGWNAAQFKLYRTEQRRHLLKLGSLLSKLRENKAATEDELDMINKLDEAMETFNRSLVTIEDETPLPYHPDCIPGWVKTEDDLADSTKGVTFWDVLIFSLIATSIKTKLESSDSKALAALLSVLSSTTLTTAVASINDLIVRYSEEYTILVEGELTSEVRTLIQFFIDIGSFEANKKLPAIIKEFQDLAIEYTGEQVLCYFIRDALVELYPLEYDKLKARLQTLIDQT